MQRITWLWLIGSGQRIGDDVTGFGVAGVVDAAFSHYLIGWLFVR